MVQACRAHGVSFFVAYYRRAMEKYRTVQRLIEDGEIGDVRYVCLRTQ